jgi:ATP-dependent DNA helicase DinG
MGQGLLRQTGDYLALMAKAGDTAAHAAGYTITNGLALRREQEAAPAAPTHVAYPSGKAAMTQLLKPRFTVRARQVKMMDAVYRHAQHGQTPLLIEAATGSGKSLGYLLPLLIHQQDSQQQIIVTTSTLALQDQLAQQTLPAIAAIMHTQLRVEIVKSDTHYIDLGQYYGLLDRRDLNTGEQLLMMKILVWLTQTTTGDLQELQLTTYRSPLFTAIVSGQESPADSPWVRVDFLRRAHARQDAAQVLITNHAYFTRHYDEAPFARNALVVVDEAQHVADSAVDALMAKGNLPRMLRSLHQIKGAIDGVIRQEQWSNGELFRYQVVSVGNAVDLLTSRFNELQDFLYAQVIQGNIVRSERNQPIQRLWQPDAVAWQTLTRYLTQIDDTLLQLFTALTQLQRYITNQAEHWSQRVTAMAATISAAAEDLRPLTDDLDQLSRIQMASHPSAGFVIQMRNYGDLRSVSLHWAQVDIRPLWAAVTRRFAPFIYVGATLRVMDNWQPFCQPLGITDAIKMVLPNGFAYKRLGRVFITPDAPDIKETPPAEYAHYVAGMIEQLSRANHQRILVLFNSLSLIQQVFDEMSELSLIGQRELLAQGVTGSVEKVMKRFKLADGAILLGAATFWEGIDLPNDTLQILVVTRLPFEPPTRPLTQLRANFITAQGGNPFYQDALPRATQRLTQAFGRLFRSRQDHGVLIILDRRIMAESWGHQMLHDLPRTVPKGQLPSAEIAQATADFLAGIPVKKVKT